MAGSQSVLTALASAMLTFIVFVFSILLLAVQLASAQLTPRVIAHFYRSRVLRLSLSLFVFVFTFDLAVLARIGDVGTPAVGVLAAYGTVAAIGVFLYMIDRVGKSLRPVSVLTSIGRVGHDVIGAVYPHRVAAAGNATNPSLPCRSATAGAPSRMSAPASCWRSTRPGLPPSPDGRTA